MAVQVIYSAAAIDGFTTCTNAIQPKTAHSNAGERQIPPKRHPPDRAFSPNACRLDRGVWRRQLPRAHGEGPLPGGFAHAAGPRRRQLDFGLVLRRLRRRTAVQRMEHQQSAEKLPPPLFRRRPQPLAQLRLRHRAAAAAAAAAAGARATRRKKPPRADQRRPPSAARQPPRRTSALLTGGHRSPGSLRTARGTACARRIWKSLPRAQWCSTTRSCSRRCAGRRVAAAPPRFGPECAHVRRRAVAQQLFDWAAPGLDKRLDLLQQLPRVWAGHGEEARVAVGHVS